MKRTTSHDFDATVRRQLKNHMIVDHMQRIVQRIDRQFGWPAEMDFLDVQCAFARYGLPVRFMHMITNHGGDDTVSVNHSDVCAISKVQDIVRGNGNALGISEFSVPRESAIAAMSFIAGKTTFPGADYCLPVMIGIRVVVGITNANDLMGFWIRYVENAVQGAQSDVITI